MNARTGQIDRLNRSATVRIEGLGAALIVRDNAKRATIIPVVAEVVQFSPQALAVGQGIALAIGTTTILRVA
jgi:hypothetical protein